LRSDALSGKPIVQSFSKAGYTTKDNRRKIINLAVAMRQREWFNGLWDRSRKFTPPVKFTPYFRLNKS
jgi:hypothetical protein